MKCEMDMADMLKLKDVLQMNCEFHANRDRMNGAVHLAKEVRHSPLTSETMSAFDRIQAIIIEQGGKDAHVHRRSHKKR